MKQYRIKNIFVLAAFALAVPVTLLAQEDGKTDKDKTEKTSKDKKEGRHNVSSKAPLLLKKQK